MADRESILLVSGLPQLEILCPGEELNPSGMIRESLTILLYIYIFIYIYIYSDNEELLLHLSFKLC